MTATIVGIGASAGGVEALAEFFGAMPADSGLTFVIVQHVARGRPSMMVEILSTHSAMRVTQIKSGDIPVPNTVYILPPGANVTIEDGVLTLTDIDVDGCLHSPIDLFFKSLAADHDGNACAIILSGTGTDGTIGVQAIKAAGGVTFAQLAESAQFPSMPNSAAKTGLIDFKLSPSNIADKLVQLETWRKQTPLKRSDTLSQDIEANLPALLDQLEHDGENDFHQYKPGTLSRRVLRRMMMRQMTQVNEYIALLRDSADERQELAHDFLIGVTQFFRNPDMFEIIDTTVLPELLQRDQDEFRVWCPGCSSGEEVFSLAILISELQEKTGDRRPWKLFGTDIDPDALATARRGVYDRTVLTPMHDIRIKTYFENDHGLLTISSDLRSMCVFARHNVLNDPPFSKVDLISCRNLMIYVDPVAQEDMVSRFHYALNPRGFLWLGPSENLSGNARLFEIIDRQARIFKRDDSVASLALPFLSTGFTSRLPLSLPQLPDMALARKSRVSIDLETDTEQAFLSTFAPPFMRISLHDEVLYASEAARRFLRPSKGMPSPVFEDYVVESVRMPLRLILKDVRQSKLEKELEDVVIEVDGTTPLYDIYARPMDQEAKSVLVAFQRVRWREESTTPRANTKSTEAVYEAELTIARKRLLARERDFKMAEQELWASNEELLTINEELQSSNEELESSREELQSVNADLEVVNAELITKNKALGISNNNLRNLIESVDIAIMFVDRQGFLKLFTPRSKDLFSIQDRDVGRSIFDLVTVLDYPELKDDLGQPEKSLTTFSREVSTQDRKHNFIVKIRPYLDAENKIDGVVVSFFEITQQLEQQWALKLASQQLSRRLSELEAFYDHAPIGAAMHGPDMRYLRVNDALVEMIGKPASGIVGRHPSEVIPDIWAQIEPIFKEIIKTKQPAFNLELSAKMHSKNNEIRTWIANFFPIIVDGRDTVEIAVTAMEITSQKRLEESLVVKQSELQDAGERMLRNFEHAPFSVVIHQGPDHIILHANQKACQILGVEYPTGKTEGDFIPEIYVHLREIYDSVYRSSKTYIDAEVPIDTVNGAGRRLKGVFRRIVQPYKDLSGEVTGVVSINMDISELVAMRDAHALQTARLTSIIDELDAQIILIDADGKILDVNENVSLMFGEPKNAVLGKSLEIIASMVMDAEAITRIQRASKAALAGQVSRYEERIVTPADKKLRRVILSVSPVRNRSETIEATLSARTENIQELLITMTDQTALLEATDRKGILVAELEHRVKNVIATIQAVTQFTASTTRDPQTMVDELEERLAAMARTHDKLTASGWEKQTFRDILSLEVSAYASTQSARVFCEGDDISLSPSTAMLVGLAVHELLTNAVKYGALSNEAGTVHICIRAKENALERLTWTERGGPKVVDTSRTGFGTLLLQSILPSELRATAELELRAEGLMYHLFKKAKRGL